MRVLGIRVSHFLVASARTLLSLQHISHSSFIKIQAAEIARSLVKIVAQLV